MSSENPKPSPTTLKERNFQSPESEEEIIEKVIQRINTELLPLNPERQLPPQLATIAVTSYKRGKSGGEFPRKGKRERTLSSLPVRKITAILAENFGSEYAPPHLIARMVSAFPREIEVVLSRINYWRKLLNTLEKNCPSLHPLIILDFCLYTTEVRVEKRIEKINNRIIKPINTPEGVFQFWRTQFEEIGYGLGFISKAAPLRSTEGAEFFGSNHALEEASLIWKAVTILKLFQIDREREKFVTRPLKYLEEIKIPEARKDLIKAIVSSPGAFPEEIKLRFGLTPEKIERLKEARKAEAIQKACEAKRTASSKGGQTVFP